MKDLSLIKKAYEKIDTIYKKKWQEYERMYNSVHSDEFLKAAKEQDRNALFIPLTYSTINIANSIFANAFFSSGNPIEITRIGENDKQKRDELTRVIEYYFKASKPYFALNLAFLSACIYGTGAVKLSWDTNLPKTELVPLSDLSFDTEALGIDDTNYVCHRFTQTIATIKEKIESGFYEVEEKDRTKFELDDNEFKRKTIQEIYKKTNDGYVVKSYCDEVLLRVAKFRKNPIHYGIILPKMPCIDRQKRENEIGAIGDSLVRIIKPLNDELNLKRNQRMDMIEKYINPEVYVPESCGIDPDDALRVGGYKHCDTASGILFAPQGVGAVEFMNDVQMLHKDIEDASSINGILRGNTNASDRRSQAALATVNANSGSRLEAMIKLINETLFEKWAKDFVRLVYINASDEIISQILETPEHSLGMQGMRAELDFDISVNFGQSFNKQQKINDLISIVQMVGANPNANVMGIMEEIITLSLGENTDAKRILGVSTLATDENINGQVGQGATTQDVSATNGGYDGARRDEEVDGSQRAAVDAWLHRARKNTL